MTASHISDSARTPVPPYSDQRRLVAPLTDAISAVLQAGPAEQRLLWHDILTEALDKLAPSAQPATEGPARDAFRFFNDLASADANAQITVTDQPRWLMRHLGAVLAEAAMQRPASTLSIRPVFGRPSRAALELTCDSEFFAWAQQCLGVKLSTRMKITYTYYEHVGQGCRVHLDDPLHYEYNCLVGLRRSCAMNSQQSSMLRIFDRNGSHRDIDLVEARAVIFNASRLAHGRTPLASGEVIWLLSIGLNAERSD